ncbi:hypothetical protein Q3C01_11400 [Bradyrhizobium sp. UFLA05-109]
MALHRDIFWIGRQWSVTGFGVQAVDQRLRGALDIEIARLWDDDFVQSRRAKPGINLEDFDKALTQARTRYPQAQAPVQVVIDLPPAPAPVAPPPKPAPPVVLALRAEGRLARFLPQWRIRR